MTKAYHTSPPQNQVFLKDQSQKDKHWDKRKVLSREIGSVFLLGDASQIKKSERVYICSNYLLFGIHMLKNESCSTVFKLKDARFCKARLCPICQSRRSLVWKARMHKAYPKMRDKYSKARFIHLTLTVKNCPVDKLKETLKIMSESFNRLKTRMTKNKTIIGFMRSVEVTREMESCHVCHGNYYKKATCKNRHNHVYTQNCHPHIHVLLAVPSDYFYGYNYLTKDDWAEEWRKALKVDYKPVAWVSIIKAKNLKKGETLDPNMDQDEIALSSAVKEVAKYSVKVDEEFLESVLKDDDGVKWFLELDRQVAGSRSIGLGGCFKEFLKDSDPTEDEMLEGQDEKELLEKAAEYRQFFFQNKFKAYTLKKILYEDKDGIIQGFTEKQDQEILGYG